LKYILLPAQLIEREKYTKTLPVTSTSNGSVTVFYFWNVDWYRRK